MTFATKVLKDLGYDQCDKSDKKKLPNVYKSCPKMISLEKLKILRPLIFFSKNVGYLSKKLLPKALKSCPKSNKFYNLVTLVTTIYLVTPSTRVPMFWETGSETSSGFTLTCSILLICIQNGSERRFQTFRRSRRRRRSHCR